MTPNRPVPRSGRAGQTRRWVPRAAGLAVLADDPAAETDVPAWCMMKSHDHVRTLPLERGWAILIRRGY